MLIICGPYFLEVSFFLAPWGAEKKETSKMVGAATMAAKGNCGENAKTVQKFCCLWRRNPLWEFFFFGPALSPPPGLQPGPCAARVNKNLWSRALGSARKRGAMLRALPGRWASLVEGWAAGRAARTRGNCGIISEIAVLGMCAPAGGDLGKFHKVRKIAQS